MTIVAVALAFVDDIARGGTRAASACGVGRLGDTSCGAMGGHVLIVIGRVSPFEEAKKETILSQRRTRRRRHDDEDDDDEDDDDERHGCKENESTGTRESFDARRRDAGRGESTARGGFSHGWMFERIKWEVPIHSRAFWALDGRAWGVWVILTSV